MTAARRIWRLMVLGMLVGVGAVAIAVWPRGPRLMWYTSPAIATDAQGRKSVRLRLLVPSDWAPRPSPFGPDALFVVSPSFSMEYPVGQFTLRPPKEHTWLPAFVRRILSSEPENASIELRVQGPGNGLQKEGVLVQQVRNDKQTGPTWLVAKRGQTLSPGYCCLQYSRTSRADFEATYRQICESFRVVR